jgi:thiamine pyrophosphate-dependent acetolactate synthase large subunit-like protein
MRAAAAADAALSWDASPIGTGRLCMEIWDQVKTLDWALVSSGLLASQWPQRLWDINKHHQFIGDSGGAGVGYGAPAAAGAALAHRDAGRVPIAIQSDGDLMVLPGTLWTLAHHKISLLMVMQNNRAWHQETMHLQRMSCRRNRGTERAPIGTVLTDPDIDFARMAQSMGVWAEGPISDPEMLRPALTRALQVVTSGKPALIDVLTQPR